MKYHRKSLFVISTALIILANAAFADSVTISETWKDSADVHGSLTTKDTGTLNASLTVPGMSGMTANDWSNLVVTINMTPYQGSQFINDVMADAPNTGGSITPTTATFFYQGFDTNGNSVNVEKIVFSRSGNTFTIVDTVLNPPAWQPPSSLLAAYYLNIDGPITDTQTYDVNLQDDLDNGTLLNVDIAPNLSVTGNNTITTDAFGDELNNVQVSATSSFTAPTAPTVTSVSPAGSTTTTTGILDVQVRAISGNGVANVEFFWNGFDVGAGSSANGNIWSQLFALAPGVNTFQTVATDSDGNNSTPNTISVTYVNSQTNAPVIQFSERYLDSAQTNGSGGNIFAFNQDAGILTAAISVPGLQSMSTSTWTNLQLSLSFGNLNFSSSLAAADVLTTKSATFNITDSDLGGSTMDVEQLIISRLGNTLEIFKRTGNPSFTTDNTPIIANLYYGTNGPIKDQQPFTLVLTDGTLLTQYANVSRTVYITGIDTITHDSNNDELDNIQVSGSADFTPPVTTITAPTVNQQWSNSVFTVTGKTTDNILVTNVFYSINNSAWAQATPSNGFWTNWTAQVNLVPGTNTIAAYSVDSSGNISATNPVSFVYILSAPLTVNETGEGAIFPIYNGTLLPLGRNFSMTATGTNGFGFVSWTGSLSTNSPTLIFTMASNLTFTANFVDVARPTNQITAPTSGLHVSNAVFVVTGKATDNVGVTNVFYSLNGGDWTNASTANNWSNWTAQVTLTPGTNTIAAYAVDGTGNVSTTNTVNFVYVLSAVLTVNVGPGGTVVTNYNGVLLQLGQTYSMTAKTNVGFAFGGWSGSSATNNPTLKFTMASNLTFTASFVDVARPTNQITAPTSGLHVSNAVFVVTGKAGDNVGVTNVFYSLNGGDWTNATTANNWSNWTAQVALTPGTNTIAAYAVDGTGNVSTTNTVNFVYVLSAVLTVNVGPGGTVVTNYNGVLLQLGQTYSMTAKTNVGFAFGGWSGSITTNNPTLKFTMASDLVFTASFVDVASPTNQITAPTSGLHVSNAVFVVTGKAGDNVGVTNVFYSLNGGGWTNATTANNWSNWTAQVTLTPGSNTIAAYAVDGTGNTSTTNTVSFFYVVSAVLQIEMTGLGKLTPNYSNAVLAVGQNYSITSSPAGGFVFTNWIVSTNWIGGATVTNKILQFMMVSNLTLEANFVDVTKPTNQITAPTANQRMPSAVATVTGTATDNWGIAGVWYQLNGGTWTLAPTTNNWTNWSQTVTLITGTNNVKAYALDLGGNYSLTNSVSFVSSNTFKLQLAFSSANPLLANGLAFSLQLSTNLSGHIQYSTNLINWVNLTNFNGTNSTLNFRDPAATNSVHRFYRAAIP